MHKVQFNDCAIRFILGESEAIMVCQAKVIRTKKNVSQTQSQSQYENVSLNCYVLHHITSSSDQYASFSTVVFVIVVAGVSVIYKRKTHISPALYIHIKGYEAERGKKREQER